MIVVDLTEPNEKQKLFLLDEHKFIAFGGARGGGKSWVIRFKAFMLALFHPGIRQLIMRRTYPELLNNHINPLKKIIPKAIAKYNATEKSYKFKNGSVIEFGYCDKEKDLDRYQGVEYDVIFIDEATQMTEYMFKVMVASVRGVNNFPKRIYLTCNPGGRGHAWVKRLFVDRIFLPGERPEDYSFIQSLVTDNKALMATNPDYIAGLDALPEKKRKAWRYGDWNVFEGQVFEEFRDNPAGYETGEWTHVINPYEEIPVDWKIYRSYDFGYSKPFSCGWWAVDHDGVIYRILELYGCVKNEANTGVKWTPQKQFEEIRRIETTHKYLKNKRILGTADPAIWKAETGESVADTAAKYGVYFEPGDHERIAGLMQLHYRLAFDDNGKPMMYIFKNCRAFIRTVPELCYSDTHPEDIDSDQEDHVYDESRYMCMTRPIAPRKGNVGRTVDIDDPLNMIADAKKNNRRK